jgi:DNA-binding MarR family transcriptional regulator
MTPTRRTTGGESATSVILSTFRLNGLLLDAGDRLSADHGLTSARWQVLGAIALSDRPLTVPQIARRMGLTRQSVHTTVDRLVGGGLIELIPNDDHVRSPLVRLTASGEDVYRDLDRDQTAWVGELARGIPGSDLESARTVLEELVRRLETSRADDRGSPRAGAGKEGR